MCIKKMLVNTNLESSQDLLHYFNNIESINEKYFNEINIYADQVHSCVIQSNEIEKYLEEVTATKKHKKTNFSNERLNLTKQEQTSL